MNGGVMTSKRYPAQTGTSGTTYADRSRECVHSQGVEAANRFELDACFSLPVGSASY